MNKVAHYLQDHVTGEVMDSAEARRYFATDSSILSITPGVIVYPMNESDVRKTTRFSWQLATRGRVIPITARGFGMDQTGAAIGSGIVIVFPAHMNRIIEFNAKNGDVVVEPGITYGKLQQALETHNRFLPPYPASVEYVTIGGSIANNSGGEKSIKYGDTRSYVKALRVVLANGEVIETGPLSKRELSKKLGLTTFEGEIYRSLDALLEEKQSVIEKYSPMVARSTAGYDLSNIKTKKTFDLTPLFVGSQGTLGIITEALVQTEIHNTGTTLVTAYFDDLKGLQKAVNELKRLSELPSAIEIVDEQLLNFIDRTNPNLLKSVISKPFPKFILFVEFDNPNDRLQKKLAKKARKIFQDHASSHQTETDEAKQAELWKIRQSTSILMSHNENGAKPLPVIEDGIVPADKLEEFIRGIYTIFQRNHLQMALWGHVGEANLSVLPFMDLSQVGDRQRIFRLMDEYYALVISLGGSISAGSNDGRIRAPYLRKMVGEEMCDVYEHVKKIFDPYNTLNPGVKLHTSIDDLKNMLRRDYSNTLFTHIPRS